jgi:hypothetical protein
MKVTKKQLRQIIKEELITLGDDQYQLSDDEVGQLKGFLGSEMSKTPHDPMKRQGRGKKGQFSGEFSNDPGWIEWTKSVGYPDDWDPSSGKAPEGAKIPVEKMKKLYTTLYSVTSSTFAAQYVNFVLDAIYSADPVQLGKDLFSLDSPPESMSVPASMKGLADINTSKGGSKGTETGRGEFVVPFLFTQGELGGANAEHDVSIDGIGWHVKELTSMVQTIRLGKNTYAGSPTGNLLQDKVGMKASELSVGTRGGDTTSVLKNLKQSVADPSKVGIMEALGETDPFTALMELQERLNEEMRETGIGDAAGVLFFVKDQLYFVPKDKCICGGATQSAHRVGMPGGTNGENGPIEEAVSDLQESLVRIVVKQLLLTEELNKSDKKEIERIAKKQAAKIVASELDKALGASFFGTKGKVNKFVSDEVSKRFRAGRKDPDFADTVETICKEILKKFHRDMALKYPQMVDRIKIR